MRKLEAGIEVEAEAEDCPLVCSSWFAVCFLPPLSTAYPALVLPTLSWALSCKSSSKKMLHGPIGPQANLVGPLS